MSEKETYNFEKVGDLFITTVCGKKFGLRKWTWGEKNTLVSECSHTDPLSGFVNFDAVNFNEQMFVKTVFYEEPKGTFKPFTVEEIRRMDGQLGDRLFRLTQKINTVSQIETANL